MTDAVIPEPTEATPAALAVAGLAIPAAAAAGSRPRSISADSFRRLTARLKSAATPPQPVPDAPLPVEDTTEEAYVGAAVDEPLGHPPASPDSSLAQEALVADNAVADTAVAEAVVAEAIVAESVEPEPVMAEPVGGDAVSEAFAQPPAVLPAFAPLADYVPEALPQHPEADADTVEELSFADVPSAAVHVDLPSFDLPQTVWPDNDARLREEMTFDPPPLPEEAPVIAQDFRVPEEEVDDTPAIVTADHHPGAIEYVLPQDAALLGAPAGETGAAPAEPVDHVSTVVADPPASQVLEPVSSTEPEPEPQPASPAAARESEQPEAKARSSEMAERVVDAMMKTISTAIYAKPSASERAAFLREMAALMAEAADQSEGKSARPGETQERPASPVVGGTVPPAAAEGFSSLPEVTVPLELPPPPPAATLRVEPAPVLEDPFAQTPPRLLEPRPQETPEADEESGELALTLLDMMSGGTGSLPHERTLAADTLLRILPRIPVKQLSAVVERVAIMETPPALLVARLIRDSRPEIIGPLLERCSQISDRDLMNAAPVTDTVKLRMIARRRTLSTVLSDFLIATGDPGVLLTLIRNPGAALTHEAFFRLAEFASRHHALLAPLTTRADLPPPVAFELFWHVPQELRRFIFSRFLTDSETLNKILRITLATHADANEEQAEAKFPSREALDEAMESASGFRLAEAAKKLAELGRISQDTALRILSDREGEPLSVLLKALGCTRARFVELLEALRRGDDGLIRPDRKPDELQAIFDSLSFNKARILLTYWDWFVRKSGPYAPHH